MDATAIAADILDRLPAHRTLGLTVVSAVDGTGVVRLPVEPPVTNVIGSLHSSGIAAVADAAALAALLSALPDEPTARRLQPLGIAARIAFVRPVRGVAVGTCTLAAEAREVLQALGSARVSTETTVAGDGETAAATGGFDWALRLAAA